MKPIAVIDFETDPFSYGKMVYPFAGCFYDGTTKHVFWGDDCAARIVEHIKKLDTEFIIYAHNGGNFDFYYMLEWIERELLLINGRIVRCWIDRQELRDSYAIFPDPLSAYKKDEFDYAKMARDRREKHKQEIIDYLIADCKYLYQIVTSFAEEFGDHLTVGSCAMKALKSFHKFDAVKEQFDERFRPYYFGGRNQCFETGIINLDRFPSGLRMYDINQQYLHVMSSVKHPIRAMCERATKIGKQTAFARIEARNFGALPKRKRNGGLDFTVERGEFFATIHEINAGLETGTLEIIKVKEAIDFFEWGTFKEFCDHFSSKRMTAKAAGDELGTLHYKRIPNSSYGKFGQDPSNFSDSYMTHDDEILAAPWELAYETRGYRIWSKPSEHKNWFNVAIGASITGGARAIMLRAIARCDTPIYADTDSLICKELKGVEIDPLKPGAWKQEGVITSLAIAGKKLYCARGQFEKGKTEKKAHKGAKLTGDQIFQIASQDPSDPMSGLEYAQDAPKFRLHPLDMMVKNAVENKLGFHVQATHRRIRKTG